MTQFKHRTLTAALLATGLLVTLPALADKGIQAPPIAPALQSTGVLGASELTLGQDHDTTEMTELQQPEDLSAKERRNQRKQVLDNVRSLGSPFISVAP